MAATLKWGVIKAFAQHLNLDDAVERSVFQRREHFLLRFWILLAVDYVRAIPTFAIKLPNVFRMIYGPGN